MKRSKDSKRITVMLLFSFYLSSCIVANFTKHNEENICSVHHEQMHRTLVGTDYGLQAYEEYIDGYPNCIHSKSMGCVVTSPRKIFAVVYYCKSCEEIRKKAKEGEKKKKACKG